IGERGAEVTDDQLVELEAFTFVFKDTEWGLFQVHAYPFEEGLSTWIVECHQDVFDRTGLGNAPDNIIDDFINIAVQNNRGLDYAVRYNTEVPWGALGFEVHATRQLEDTKGISSAAVEEINGRVGDPELVGDWNVTLDRGAWSFFYGGNYIGTSSDEEHFGSNIVTYRGVQYRAVLNTEAITYHSFSVQYTFDNYGLTALVGIANAFDEEPPQLTRQGTDAEYTMIGNAVLASQYDWLGRRFFLNLKLRFD
ncbi:MAG: hypothetical protein IH891_01995, partial [Planctomycetes bacterium]|nr:hypothetical protein [Planctomycetota bacterium]